MDAATKRSDPINAPISVGELIDKITILQIKAKRFADADKIENVTTELNLLLAIQASSGLDHPTLQGYADQLRAINATLWEIEEEIRELEAHQDFGARFVELARSIYRTNDQRSQVKRAINEAFGSGIVEEKSYKTS